MLITAAELQKSAASIQPVLSARQHLGSRQASTIIFRQVSLSGTVWDSVTLHRGSLGDLQSIELHTRQHSYDNVRNLLMQAPADLGLSQLVPASSLFYATEVRVCQGEDGVTVVVKRPSRAA